MSTPFLPSQTGESQTRGRCQEATQKWTLKSTQNGWIIPSKNVRPETGIYQSSSVKEVLLSITVSRCVTIRLLEDQ